jgi:hypothetical protein
MLSEDRRTRAGIKLKTTYCSLCMDFHRIRNFVDTIFFTSGRGRLYILQGSEISEIQGNYYTNIETVTITGMSEKCDKCDSM